MFSFIKRINSKQFWDWFCIYESEYYELEESGLNQRLLQLSKKLSKVDPNLTFEFSSELIKGKRHFIISADGIREAFPVVLDLVERAPLDKNRWVLNAFRQRSGLNDIEYEDVTLKPEHLYFTYEIVERDEKKEIDCEIFIDIPNINDEIIGAVFIFLDNLIGEYDVTTKLGNIDFHELKRGVESLIPIEKLVDIVDSL